MARYCQTATTRLEDEQKIKLIPTNLRMRVLFSIPVKLKCSVIDFLFGQKVLTCVFLYFYLPHMEYEGSIGFVMRKMIFFSRSRTFYGQKT
jgi:hypothetical protein